MKVLWICNMMLPAVAEELGQEGSNKEGWVHGLCGELLKHQKENEIELHIAFPVTRALDDCMGEITEYGGKYYYYGFYEDTLHAEYYDASLEESMLSLVKRIAPDVIHCFGTEYAHTLAMFRCVEDKKNILLGIQGLCGAIAKAYMADLPEKVQESRTFRDIIKRDSMKEQQEKFVLRGKREEEILSRAEQVTGRTEFDRLYLRSYNTRANYFAMNETLRAPFYEKIWDKESCEPYSIFVSQGDYPLKGLHYLLIAAKDLLKKYPNLQIYVAGNSLVSYHSLKDKIKISAYGKYLRSLIQKGDLENRIHFTGKLTALEMRDRYLRSSVFVCCSSNENSPNSLGEAMLLGMPCVAADVGGISSIFQNGEDGILYSGYEMEWEHVDYHKSRLLRNAENLGQAISQIWEQPEQTEIYARNCREHAKITHDGETNYQALMEIYAEIAERNERG